MDARLFEVWRWYGDVNDLQVRTHPATAWEHYEYPYPVLAGVHCIVWSFTVCGHHQYVKIDRQLLRTMLFLWCVKTIIGPLYCQHQFTRLGSNILSMQGSIYCVFQTGQGLWIFSLECRSLIILWTWMLFYVERDIGRNCPGVRTKLHSRVLQSYNSAPSRPPCFVCACSPFTVHGPLVESLDRDLFTNHSVVLHVYTIIITE
jgi:hypothetical protein